MLVHEQRATPVAAYGGRLAWSHFDPASRKYWLMTRVSGVTTRVGIAPRGSPFDVSLGPDSNGHTVAVFSRCQVERVPLQPPPAPPFWQGADRGCAIHTYDFTTARETAVRAASVAGLSATLPSVWGNTVAFAREDTPGDQNHQSVYIAPLHGAGRARRVHGGETRTAPVPGRLPGGLRMSYYTPTGIALRGQQLAVTWQAILPLKYVGDDYQGDVQIWLGRYRDKRLKLRWDVTVTGQIDKYFYAPTFAANKLWTMLLLTGDSEADVLNYVDLRTGRWARAALPVLNSTKYAVDGFPSLLSLAADGTTLYASRAGGASAYNSCQDTSATPTGPTDCQITQLDPGALAFYSNGRRISYR